MKLDQKNYVDIAEKAIMDLREMKGRNGRPEPMVTTSQIRNLLAMTADIYNDVVNSQSDILSDEVIGRINYLKIRFVYEAGRDGGRPVKNLMDKADILNHIQNINGRKSNYIVFSRYMEALVAFRKFYGDRDA